MKNAIITHRRRFNANLEVGMEVSETVEYMKKELIKLGDEPQMCGKGVIAQFGDV